VKRTFSRFSQSLTGLPGVQPHQAEGQDPGDVAQALVGAQVIRVERVFVRCHAGKMWLRKTDEKTF
jgi:hypothetical protein